MSSFTGACLLMIIFLPDAILCARVFPSHYSFKDDDVIPSENDTNVCANYDENADEIATFNTSQYVMCGGNIRLSDSDYGPQQYSDSDQDRFYIWKRSDDSQLLFTFPSTVQLTYITLHYYSDSCASLPIIAFKQVDSQWKIWRNVPSKGSLDGIDSTLPLETGSLNSTTHNITGFSSSQLLMVITAFSRQDQSFFLSEVEFFNNLSVPEAPTTYTTQSAQSTGRTTTCNIAIDSVNATLTTQNEDITSTTLSGDTSPIEGGGDITPTTPSGDTSPIMGGGDITPTTQSEDQVSRDNNGIIIAVVAAMVVLLAIVVVALVIIGVIVLVSRRKKRGKLSLDPEQTQIKKPNTHQEKPVDVTDNESKDTSSDGSVILLISPPTVKNMHNAVVKESNNNNVIPEKGDNNDVIPLNDNDQTSNNDTVANGSDKVSPAPLSTVDDLYSVVQKKSKKVSTDFPNEDEDAPPIPPHTVDELYSVVQKKAKNGDMDALAGDEDAPPIPPHTVEEMYSVVHKKPKQVNAEGEGEDTPPIPPHTVEEMYSVVQKKSKKASTDLPDEGEDAPPIPPHTVDELYAAVYKKPKKDGDQTTAKEENDVPRMPPHTEEDM